jgi:hypothetical protein
LLREDFFCTIKTVESDQSFELVQQIPRSAGNYLPVHLQLLKFLLAVRGKNASFELFSVGLLSVEPLQTLQFPIILRLGVSTVSAAIEKAECEALKLIRRQLTVISVPKGRADWIIP